MTSSYPRSNPLKSNRSGLNVNNGGPWNRKLSLKIQPLDEIRSSRFCQWGVKQTRFYNVKSEGKRKVIFFIRVALEAIVLVWYKTVQDIWSKYILIYFRISGVANKTAKVQRQAQLQEQRYWSWWMTATKFTEDRHWRKH